MKFNKSLKWWIGGKVQMIVELASKKSTMHFNNKFVTHVPTFQESMNNSSYNKNE